jgi:tetratricopeptide (TPR) repeat protein
VLRRGLAKDPDCLGGWVLMGRCYLAMGEVEIAKGLLESSAARDPENALALRGLAQVHALEGDRRRAVEEYRVLLRLMPRDLEAHEALAWLLAQGETETPSLLAAKATPRRPSRRQAPRPVYPPRGSRAALKAEPRVNPGLFEAPPADLDRDAASPVAQRRERRSKTANRSPRVLDHVDTPELSVSGAEPKAPVRRSLKDYEQWMQRMAQNQVPARDDPQDGSNPVDPIASGGE